MSARPPRKAALVREGLFWGLACALTLGACVKLDGFLFDSDPASLDDYDFSSEELDGIDPARITSELIDSGDAQIHVIYVERDETKLDPRLDPADGITVVFSHGNRANLLNYWYRAGFFEDMGFNVLFYDYRGYGASTGETTEQNTYEDAETALDYARTKAGVGKILSVGYSMGGGPAIWLCSPEGTGGGEREGADACFTESSIANTELLITAGVGWDMPGSWYLDVEYDNVGRIDTVNVPVLMMHGKNDVRIAVEHAHLLWAAVQDNNPINIYYEDPQAGHRNVPTPSYTGEFEPKEYSYPDELPPDLRVEYEVYKGRIVDFVVEVFADAP